MKREGNNHLPKAGKGEGTKNVKLSNLSNRTLATHRKGQKAEQILDMGFCHVR